MAQRVQIQLLDDLTGEQIPPNAGETVRFALDGAHYEIDLAADNATALRAILRPYAAAGRRLNARLTTGPAAPGTTRARTRTDPAQLAAIRDWARRNGYTVSNKGRIADSVVQAFEQAH